MAGTGEAQEGDAAAAADSNSLNPVGNSADVFLRSAKRMESIYPSERFIESQPAIGQASRYTQPAPPDEVMMEQLEFLLLHARNGRHLACSECARLDRIGSVLLAPFL